MMRLSSVLLICLMLCLSLLAGGLYADEAPRSFTAAVNQIAGDTVAGLNKAAPQGSTLAIYYFTTDGRRTRLGEVFAAELMAAIVKTKKASLTLVSRQKLDEVTAEQSYALSDLTDPAKRVKVGMQLSATHIASGFIFFEKTAVRVTCQVIGVEKGDIVASISQRFIIDKSLESYVTGTSLALLDVVPPPTPVEITSQPTSQPQITPPKVTTPASFTPVPYVWDDKFNSFNKKVWEDISISDEVAINARDGLLVFTAPYREGRLNSINTITTKPFKVQSFTFEIAFKDVLASAETVSLFVGNVNWRAGNSMQLIANFTKEYYKFAWTENGDWTYHDDNIRDLFSDEAMVFHRLKVAYDQNTKTAYAFLDDVQIDKVENLSFLRADKLHVSVTITETTSETGKDMEVVLDDFKSSVAF